ncbi:hypothetical protein [Paenibacillus sp. EKM11P]|uniref:hypothetical protein n=1 Tax=Paenibacillus sp. EKM11P TaxID=2708057 RepID=UPI001A9BF094|nr:hypothetical protein [Paenibacillus sp. EKM11P]MDN4106612.1 hypothetical protein [Paenibacillus polymyxa]
MANRVGVLGNGSSLARRDPSHLILANIGAYVFSFRLMIPVIFNKFPVDVASNGTKQYFIGMINNLKINLGKRRAPSYGEGDCKLIPPMLRVIS